MVLRGGLDILGCLIFSFVLWESKALSGQKSATVAIIWVVLALVSAILIAYFGRMLGWRTASRRRYAKMVFIELARMLFPAFIAGLLMAAIIAASMSTADSQLLVASSSFTADIYKPVFRKKATDKEVLWSAARSSSSFR